MKPDPATPSSSSSSSFAVSGDDDAINARILSSSSSSSSNDVVVNPASPPTSASPSSSSGAFSDTLKQRIMQDIQHTSRSRSGDQQRRPAFAATISVNDDDASILNTHREFFLGIMAAIMCFVFFACVCTVVQRWRSRRRPSSAAKKLHQAHLVAVCSDDDR